MKNKLVLIPTILTFFLLLPTAYAFQANFEQSGVGRIVGDTPDELLQQLQTADLSLQHASYYTNEIVSSQPSERLANTNKILSGHFSNNIQSKTGGRWTFDDIKNEMKNFKTNEFLIIEAEGEFKDSTIHSSNGIILLGSKITPADTSEWTNKFKEKKPLFLFDSDYAGLYLPKSVEGANSFVGQLGQDSTIISPTAIPDKEFVLALLCSLGINSGKDIGTIFKEARNRYYWNSNVPYGLALMSYELYGNPLADTKLPNVDQKALKEFCKTYMPDANTIVASQLSPSLGATSLSTQPSYTLEKTFTIADYSLVNEGNFQLISIDGMVIDKVADDLMLPKKTEIEEFPLKTLIESVSLVSLENPVELTVNLPMWDGSSAIERTCWYDKRPAGIKISHTFSEDKESVLTTINPIEVVDCTTGKVKLYKTIKYSIKYSPFSSVLIKSVDVPKDVLPDSTVKITATVKNLRTTKVEGKLLVKADDVILSSEKISLNGNEIKAFELSLPTTKSATTYKLEYSESETKTSTAFRIVPKILDLSINSNSVQSRNAPLLMQIVINNRLKETINGRFNLWLTDSNGNIYKPIGLDISLKPGINKQFVKAELTDTPAGGYTINVKIDHNFGTDFHSKPLSLTDIQYTAYPKTIATFSDGKESPTLNLGEQVSITIPNAKAIIKSAKFEIEPTSTNYPSNVIIDVGNDGTVDVTIDSLNGRKEVDITDAIQSYLLNCQSNCNIPIKINSDSQFTAIILKNLKIEFESYDYSPIVDIKENIVSEEGKVVDIGLNAFDLNGDKLTISTSKPLDEKGTWHTSYTDAGDYKSTVTVSDGKYTVEKTVSISIKDVNRAPRMKFIDDMEASEGEKIRIVVDATDLDSDKLIYSVSDSRFIRAAGLSATDLQDNVFIWQTKKGDTGVYSVDLSVSDGKDKVSQNVLITVNKAPNLSPVMEPIGDKNVKEGETLSFIVKATDPNGDTLTYSTSNLPTGAVFKDQKFEWTPTFEQAGTYQVTFEVSDGNLKDTQTMTITVNNVNRQPALNPIADQLINENEAFIITLQATDPDGDVLTFSTNAIKGVLTNNIYKWQTTFDDAGVYNIEFKVSDGDLSDSKIAKITVNNVNRKPVLSLIGDKTINENQLLEFTVTASDEDGGMLTYSADNLPSGATFSNQKFTWTPTFEQSGIYQLLIKVSDSKSEVTQTVKITVNNINRQPKLESIGDKSVDENSKLSFEVTASDPDNDKLTYSVNNLPQGASFSNQLFTWTPSFGQRGSYTITFEVSDGNLKDSQTIIINVKKVNRKPEITSLPTATDLKEGETKKYSITAIDADKDPLSVKWYLDGKMVSDKSVFEYSPDYNSAGDHAIKVVVSDSELEVSHSFTQNVVNVNRAPKLEPINDITVKEGELVTITPNAIDSDNDKLTFSFTPPLNSNGMWQTTSNDAGTYKISVTVSDGQLSDSQKFTIRVIKIETRKGEAKITIPSIEAGKSADIDIDKTEELAFKKISISTKNSVNNIQVNVKKLADKPEKIAHANGKVHHYIQIDKSVSETDISQVTIRFEIEKSWIASKRIDQSTIVLYRYENNAWNKLQTKKLIESTSIVLFEAISPGLSVFAIAGESVNNAPVLNPIPDQVVKEGETVTISLSATDADSDALTYSTNALKGSLSNAVYTWKTTFDDAGVYNIEFKVSDGDLSDSKIAKITVSNVNRQPKLDAIGDKSVDENSKLSFEVKATDPDGDTLTYTVSNLPNGAKFENQQFTWTPTFEQSGIYTITFEASDGNLKDTQTIKITVNNINRQPQISSPPTATALKEGESKSFSVSATDADGDKLSYKWYLDSKLVSEKSTFDYSPDFNSAGEHKIKAMVSDGHAEVSHEFTQNVINVNRAPKIGTVTPSTKINVKEDEKSTISVTASDPDNDKLIYYWTLDGKEVSKTESYTYHPDFDSSGRHTIKVVVSDPEGLKDAVDIVVEVANVNRKPVITNAPGDTEMKVGESREFSVTATDPDVSSTLSYKWHVNSQSSSTSQTFNFKADSPGTYTVEINVADEFNAVSTHVFKIEVKPKPQPPAPRPSAGGGGGGGGPVGGPQPIDKCANVVCPQIPKVCPDGFIAICIPSCDSRIGTCGSCISDCTGHDKPTPSCTLSANPYSGTGPLSSTITVSYRNLNTAPNTITINCDASTTTATGCSGTTGSCSATCSYPAVESSTAYTLSASASETTCSSTTITVNPPPAPQPNPEPSKPEQKKEDNPEPKEEEKQPSQTQWQSGKTPDGKDVWVGSNGAVWSKDPETGQWSLYSPNDPVISDLTKEEADKVAKEAGLAPSTQQPSQEQTDQGTSQTQQPSENPSTQQPSQEKGQDNPKDGENNPSNPTSSPEEDKNEQTSSEETTQSEDDATGTDNSQTGDTSETGGDSGGAGGSGDDPGDYGSGSSSDDSGGSGSSSDDSGDDSGDNGNDNSDDGGGGYDSYDFGILWGILAIQVVMILITVRNKDFGWWPVGISISKDTTNKDLESISKKLI